MPLEGHWQRTQTPLRSISRRELRALVVAAAAIAGAALVLVLTAAGSSSKAGCIDATIASTTGGAQVHACGAQAKQFCRQQIARNTVEARATRADCARLER